MLVAHSVLVITAVFTGIYILLFLEGSKCFILLCLETEMLLEINKFENLAYTIYDENKSQMALFHINMSTWTHACARMCRE